MRIFLAGSTGVIGRRVIPLLIARGDSVTAVTRSASKSALLAKLGATPAVIDLFDLDRVRREVKGHDAIINLATSIPPSSRALLPWAWRENARVRRYVSANLSSAGTEAGVEHLIQESFAPVYAAAGDEWIDELSPVSPPRYNRTVVDAERAAARFATNGGVSTVLRFAYFYGPDSGFFLDAIRMVRKGWAPSLGDPEGFISSVSHDDAALAVVAALAFAGGTYNVTDDEPMRKREFYASLANALGVPAPRFFPSWISHLTGSIGGALARSQRISNRKLRALGWRPKYLTVKDGWSHAIAGA